MTGLIVHSEMPFNAEPPLDRLRARFTTPQSDFYVRSHGAVPAIEAAAHRLRVAGRVAKPLDLSMQDLQGGFPQRTVMAVLQCAGNRRADLDRVRSVTGDKWGGGAIGNAVWTGVSLAEVLRAAGADMAPELQVAFEACDTIPDGPHYGASIPMPKALCPDVLLAFGMNGERLAPEHGFPLRLVVPGFAGVRNVKWLARLTVQDEPSGCPIQQSDYKLLPPDVTPDTVDWEKGLTINEMPLNAVICEPADGAHVKAGPATLFGYATVSGRRIERVDISDDGGTSWSQAVLQHRPDTPWSWTFWEATISLAPGTHELAVRAWDSAGQTQPASAADAWNFKGYLCAAWHRITVHAA